jgi:hypothetical protein
MLGAHAARQEDRVPLMVDCRNCGQPTRSPSEFCIRSAECRRLYLAATRVRARPKGCDTGPGWVYFIGEAGSDEYVKIGFTRDLNADNRRKALQTGNPRKLEILVLCQVDDVRAVEHTFHQLVESNRVQDEWFRQTPAVRHFIATLVNAGAHLPT